MPVSMLFNICRKQECMSYANPSKTENMAKREKVDVCVCVTVQKVVMEGEWPGSCMTRMENHRPPLQR